jgi:hypothetical protein
MLRFEHVPVEHPAMSRLLAELRWSHVNGGALLASFAVHDPPASGFWFQKRTPAGDHLALELFLTSSALATALPMLRTNEGLVCAPEFVWRSAFTLDGELVAGSASGAQ